MCFKRLTLACSFVFFALLGVNAQSTQGTDFWVTFLQNCDIHKNSSDFFDLELSVTCQRSCEVLIENDSTGYSKTITLPANSTQTIKVPFEDFNLDVYGKAVNKSLHITSTDSISVYLTNSQLCSMESTVALPTSACGSYYITQMNKVRVQSQNYNYFPAIFSVIAFEDGTEVEITPSLQTSAGQPANEPFTVTLNKGEVYAVQTTSLDQGKDFSGSQIRVKDSDKKVAVFVGNQSACVPEPFSQGDGDNLWDVAYPVSSWGQKFVLVPYQTGRTDIVKCTASEKGATIYKSGEKVAELGPYESYEIFTHEEDGAFELESSEPIEVYQYMTSNNYDGPRRPNGGPSYQYIAPIEQSIQNVAFNTFDTEGVKHHYLNLIINAEDKDEVTLDGKTGFVTFQEVDGDSDYLFASIEIASGSHVVTAPNGVVANMYGTGSDISYAYSAGSCMNVINPQTGAYKVKYEGNGATDGKMADHVYEIGSEETTQLDENKFEKVHKVTFDTQGGNDIDDIESPCDFDGWLQDEFLTKTTNDWAANWTNAFPEYTKLTKDDSLNVVNVSTQDATWERLYSKAVYMPKGNHTLKFSICSPTGYEDLTADSEILQMAVCSTPQTGNNGERNYLTDGTGKSSVYIEEYDPSTKMVDKELTVYSTGEASYFSFNCGNIKDNTKNEFRISPFVLYVDGESSIVLDDKANTVDLVREESGTISLKAQWGCNKVELPLPEREGYTFKGWNTESDGTGDSYSAGDEILVDTDIELFAIWKETPKSEIPDNVFDVTCTQTPDSNAFDMVEAYSVKGVNSMSSPLVGDIDGDGTPEIIACVNSSNSPYYSKDFYVIDGKTSEVKYTITTPEYYMYGQCMALADVDKDGKSEIFLMDKSKTINCYDYKGELLWKSDAPATDRFLLSVADLNGDGEAEIVCGETILNAKTGTLLVNGTMEADGKGFMSPHNFHVNNSGEKNMDKTFYMYSLADFDGDGELEMAAGNTIYKINITNNDGTEGNTFKTWKQAGNTDDIKYLDGGSISVDFDGDGDVDVCTFAREVDGVYDGYFELNFYVWDGQTSELIATYNLDKAKRGFSIPFCSDLNNDGLPEVVVNTSNGMYVLAYDSNETGNTKLVALKPEFQETAGFTAFDFNQDGRTELVFRGMSELYIVDGETLEPLSDPITAFSGTITEYPVVADVDGDGHAEILVTRGYDKWNGSSNSEGYLSVYKSEQPGAWSSARKVWNQWIFNSVNVNEDLTIPQNLFNLATEFPNGEQVFNSFLQQQPYIDSNGNLFNVVPDLLFGPDSSAVKFSKTKGYEADLVLTNQGGNVSLKPLLISFYDADSMTLLGVDTLTDCEIQVDSVVRVKSVLSDAPNAKNLILVVNDSTLSAHQPECDYTNNYLLIELPCDSLFTNLSDSICAGLEYISVTGKVYTETGLYCDTLVNDAGCDSLVYLDLTVLTPDTVSLYDTVLVGNSYLKYGFDIAEVTIDKTEYVDTLLNMNGCDSIVILKLKVEELELLQNGPLCEDDDIVLTVNGLSKGTLQWRCPDDRVLEAEENTMISKAKLTDAGVYTLELIQEDGLKVVGNVNVDIFPKYDIDTTITIQQGEKYEFAAKQLVEPGFYTYVYESVNGCDSLVNLELVVKKLELSQNGPICEGDDIQLGVEGLLPNRKIQWRGPDNLVYAGSDLLSIPNAKPKDSGVYTLELVLDDGNVVIDEVNVDVFPKYVIDTVVAIQKGESYSIGSQELTEAGQYSFSFKSVNGCDSLVNVELVVNGYTLLQNGPLCEGDDLLLEVIGLKNGQKAQWRCPDDRVLEAEEKTVISKVKLTDAGVYTLELIQEDGLKVVGDVNVDIFPKYDIDTTITIQQGEKYEFAAKQLVKSGFYTYVYESVNGCDSMVNLELVVKKLELSQNGPICEGDDIQLGVEGLLPNRKIQWRGPGNLVYAGSDLLSIPNAKPKDSGVYTLELVLDDGNVVIDEVNVDVFPKYVIDTVVTIQKGESYSIGSQELTEAGQYSFSFNTVNGCDSLVNVELVVNGYTLLQNGPLCEGDDLLLEVIGLKNGQKAQWRCPDDELIPISGRTRIIDVNTRNSGDYILEIINDNGVVAVDKVTVDVFPKYEIDTTVTIWEGETYRFDSRVLADTGHYTANFKTVNGCDSIVNLTLLVDSIEVNVTTENNGPVCSGETLVLTARNIPSKAKVRWSGPDGFVSEDSIVTLHHVSSKMAGEYKLDVILSTRTVKAPSTFVDIYSGNNVKVYEKMGAEEIVYNDLVITVPGEYVFNLTNEHGCDSVVTLYVQLDWDLFEIVPDPYFTPDGDGIHDTWFIKGVENSPTLVKIFDRFGKLLRVFDAYDNLEGWDGKDSNGYDLPSADYWYTINNHTIDKSYVGHVSLLRR